MSVNDDIAARLEEFADLLEAQDVAYKPRAYRRAAENVRAYPGDIARLAHGGEDALDEIAELEELREELPVDIEALTRVEGVGPKTVGTLYEALGVETLDDLEAAAEAGEIRDVSGFGATTEQNILENIEFAREATERELLGQARPRGEGVVDFLADHPAVDRIDLAGSLRRWKETIGDVDVLVGSEAAETVVDAFTDWPDADAVIEAGDQKASVRSGEVRVDLRVVDPSEFGSALQYFTGSKDHNVKLRNIAIERDLKMNEYGIFDVSSEALSASGDRTESGDEVDAPDDEVDEHVEELNEEIKTQLRERYR